MVRSVFLREKRCKAGPHITELLYPMQRRRPFLRFTLLLVVLQGWAFQGSHYLEGTEEWMPHSCLPPIQRSLRLSAPGVVQAPQSLQFHPLRHPVACFPIILPFIILAVCLSNRLTWLISPSATLRPSRERSSFIAFDVHGARRNMCRSAETDGAVTTCRTGNVFILLQVLRVDVPSAKLSDVRYLFQAARSESQQT